MINLHNMRQCEVIIPNGPTVSGLIEIRPTLPVADGVHVDVTVLIEFHQALLQIFEVKVLQGEPIIFKPFYSDAKVELTGSIEFIQYISRDIQLGEYIQLECHIRRPKYKRLSWWVLLWRRLNA